MSEPRSRSFGLRPVGLRPKRGQSPSYPIPITRFRSFRTQPLESLSAAVKLPIKKRFLGSPTLGTNLGQRILAMRTGCRVVVLSVLVVFPFQRITVLALCTFSFISCSPFCRFSQSAVSKLVFSVSGATLRVAHQHHLADLAVCMYVCMYVCMHACMHA